jgi:cell division protein FtsB
VKGILVIPVVLVMAGLHATLDEDAGIRRWLHLRTELSDSRGRIAQLDAEVAELRASAARLEHDRFAIESAIREELGLARAGQRVVRLRPRGLSSN